MKPKGMMAVLTAVFYCVSIFKVFRESGGAVIMGFIIKEIQHYADHPWDILGLPFLLVAIGLTIWLVYDTIRARYRKRAWENSRAVGRLIEQRTKDAMAQARLVQALNEAREKLGLPPVDVRDMP